MNSIKIAVVLIAALFVFAPSAVNAQVNEVLKRLDAHNNALVTLKAGISREVYNSQLKETDRQSGTILYKRGKGKDVGVLLNWVKPRVEKLSVLRDKYLLYIPSIKQAYRGSSSDKRAKEKGGNVLALISMSKQEIKSTYDAVSLGMASVNGTDTIGLRLTPKSKAEYKYVEVWVDGNGMPIQIKVTKNNNDTDTVRLSGIKKNEEIPNSELIVDPPAGTSVVKG